MSIDISTLAAEADALSSAWLDGDPVGALERFEVLRADLRRALATATEGEHAAALAEALALDGEGLPDGAVEEVLAQALAIAGDEPRPVARILVVRARARYLLGHYNESTADAAKALEVLQPYPSDDPLVLRAVLYAAVADRDTGQLPRARRRSAEVGRCARARGDERLAAWADLHEASAALMLGHVECAETGYRRALEAARRLGMRRVEALATTNLAHVALEARDLAHAEREFRDAAALFRAIGDRLLANKLEVRIARIVLERGDTTGATALASAAELVARRVDDRDTAVRASFVIGRAHLAEALSLAQKNGFVSMLAHLDSDRAPTTAPPSPPPLRIAPDATWFEPPGGQRVDLRTRVPLRRLLQHLVERRMATPDAAATTDDLVGAGWPTERILVDAARDRVYSAVGMLRRLGLERLIVRRDGGYALDTAVRLVIG